MGGVRSATMSEEENMDVWALAMGHLGIQQRMTFYFYAYRLAAYMCYVCAYHVLCM